MKAQILGLMFGALIASPAMAEDIKFEDACKAELNKKLDAITTQLSGHTGSPTSKVKVVGQQAWSYDTFTAGVHTVRLTLMFLITDDDGWTWNAIGRSEGHYSASNCDLNPIKIESQWTCNKNIPCEK